MLDHSSQIRWPVCLKFHRFAVFGVLKFEPPGVQGLPVYLLLCQFFRSIMAVAYQRVTVLGELYPYLIFQPGIQIYLHEGSFGIPFEHLEGESCHGPFRVLRIYNNVSKSFTNLFHVMDELALVYGNYTPDQ